MCRDLRQQPSTAHLPLSWVSHAVGTVNEVVYQQMDNFALGCLVGTSNHASAGKLWVSWYTVVWRIAAVQLLRYHVYQCVMRSTGTHSSRECRGLSQAH